MIIFVYGTSAEAIKIAPLARRLTQRGIAYHQILTMQHGQKLIESAQRLGFVGSQDILPNGSKGKSLQNSYSAIKWIFAMIFWISKNRKRLRTLAGTNSLVIVHGDTLTTVMGTVFARVLRMPSAHIEAGLRSGDWRNPFPEELDRRIAGRIANIHYVPTIEAKANMEGRPNVVFTHGNTVIDSVLDVEAETSQESAPYAVCLLHRYEFLSNIDEVKSTLSLIEKNSPCVVNIYTDDFSGKILKEYIPADSESVLRQTPKLPYEEFIAVLRGALFVITDSGGIQAECAQLGIPTLIHRKATEQWEGVGKNISLSYWDSKITEHFLNDFEKQRSIPMELEFSPTEIVLEDLTTRGFISPTSGGSDG